MDVSTRHNGCRGARWKMCNKDRVWTRTRLRLAPAVFGMWRHHRSAERNKAESVVALLKCVEESTGKKCMVELVDG